MLRTLWVSHGRSPETVVIAVFDMSSVHPLGGDFAEGRVHEPKPVYTLAEATHSQKQFEPGALTLTGTRLYCAPEVLDGEPPNEANDATRAKKLSYFFRFESIECMVMDKVIPEFRAWASGCRLHTVSAYVYTNNDKHIVKKKSVFLPLPE